MAHTPAFPPPRASHYRLLLIEDDPGDADLAVERLSEVPGYSFDLERASTMAQATSRLQSRPYDAALLDLNLPDSTGLASLETVRRLHPDLPVIVLSGDDRPNLRDEVSKAGACEFIGKNEPGSLLLARTVLYALERLRSTALHQSIHTIISESPDGVVVTDANGVVMFVNRAAVEIMGRSEDSLRGERLGFSVKEGQTLEIEIDRGAERRHAELRVVQCDWRDEPAFLTTIRDITERTVLAAQLRHAQKLDALGKLAGGVAHDFNNLLTVIMACAEFSLEAVPPDHAAHRQLLEIQRAGRRAAALTQQLLTFARRRVAVPRVVDLGAAVSAMQSMLQRLIGEHIAIKVTAQSRQRVNMDPNLFGQVVVNLAVNARDAMPNGGTMTIGVTDQVLLPAAARRLLLAPGSYVCLTVSDTGQGMDASVRERIFEPFFTTKKDRGTGLGLSTVHGIVAQGGGAIVVDSEPNQGTTFTVLLPATELQAAPDEPPQVDDRAFDGPERILIIEDDATVRAVLERLLRSHGYSVEACRNGAEALAQWRAHPGEFQLVMTDVVMLGMSGWEVGRALHAEAPNLPVIYMSGYSEEVIANYGVAETHDVVLIQKPFSTQDVLRTVRASLDAV